MHILFGNLFLAAGKVLALVMWVYIIAVAAYTVFGWITPLRNLPLYRVLEMYVGPVLRRVRKLLHRFRIDTGSADFSPLIVIVVVYFLGIFLSTLLGDLATYLRPSG